MGPIDHQTERCEAAHHCSRSQTLRQSPLRTQANGFRFHDPATRFRSKLRRVLSQARGIPQQILHANTDVIAAGVSETQPGSLRWRDGIDGIANTGSRVASEGRGNVAFIDNGPIEYVPKFGRKFVG
jgi:hypothetical protein